VVIILSEWATILEYLAPGLTDEPEWLAMVAVSEVPFAGGHRIHEGEQIPLVDLYEAGNYFEITIKEVTDPDTFDLTQEEYQEAYLDAHAAIQTDWDTAVPLGGYRMNVIGYEDLESIVAVGFDVVDNPEPAQIHRDDFNLVFKSIVVPYQ